MKKTALSLLCLAISLSTASADDLIKGAMKKNWKPEDAVAKKVGKGEATDAELDSLIKCVQAICGATPPRGEKAAWVEKCKALVGALQKVKAKDAAGISEFKKANNCKACHDVFKPVAK